MIEIMNYKGKEIYYLDASSQTTENIQEIKEDMEKIKRLIRSKPPKSALMITNVTNVRFNREMTELFKEYASHNTPYVKASALVGVSGIQKVVLTAVKTLTGRDYYLANSLEEAKEWVVNTDEQLGR
jgi:GTP-dependent phosphoenolpyruvate carboxykinase